MKEHSPLLAVLLALSFLAACADSRDVTSVNGARDQRPAFASLSASQQAVILSARERAAPLARIHTTMMVDFRSNRRAWLGPNKRDSKRVCEGLVALASKYFDQINSAAGARLSEADRAPTIRRAVSNALPCKQLPQMTLFAGGAVRLGLRASLLDDDIPTGAFLDHISSLQSALDAAAPSPSAMSGALNDFLASVSSLPVADFDVLVDIGALAVESASYWNSVANTGGGGSFAEPPEYETSIFRTSAFDINWGKVKGVTIADAAGCAGGVLDKWYFWASPDPITKGILGASCLIWGGTASVGAYAVL